MSDMINEVMQRGTEFTGGLAEAARRNPLAAALIGMGMVWILTGARTKKHAGEFIRHRLPIADDAFEGVQRAVRSGADTIGKGLASAAESLESGAGAAVSEAARFGKEQAGAVSDYAKTLPQTGSQVFRATQSTLTDLFKAQPLAIGALGLAIGAGVAASLPITDVEASYLGEPSDTVKENAAAFVEEKINRAAELGTEMFNAGAEEARQQGLTPQDARSAAATISEKIGRVIETAGKGISRKIT
jgi:hypothetical protein